MSRINLRKTILINKRFQFSILTKIALIGLLIEVIFYSSNIYFFRQLENQAMLAGLAPDNVFFQFLNAQKEMMNKIFVVSTLLSLSLIFFGGFYISHRIAGPLYRLTQHLKTYNYNNIKPVKFRKGDYFPEIQEAFNEFIERK